MDGTKPSLNPASEIYAGIGTAKAPLVVGAPRGGRNANHRMIIGAVLWPPTTLPYRAGTDTQSEPVGPGRL